MEILRNGVGMLALRRSDNISAFPLRSADIYTLSYRLRRRLARLTRSDAAVGENEDTPRRLGSLSYAPFADSHNASSGAGV